MLTHAPDSTLFRAKLSPLETRRDELTGRQKELDTERTGLRIQIAASDNFIAAASGLLSLDNPLELATVAAALSVSDLGVIAQVCKRFSTRYISPAIVWRPARRCARFQRRQPGIF